MIWLPSPTNWKKATRGSQHEFTKGKIMGVFYDVITGWVDEGRAVDVAYLDFSKALDKTVQPFNRTGTGW